MVWNGNMHKGSKYTNKTTKKHSLLPPRPVPPFFPPSYSPPPFLKFLGIKPRAHHKRGRTTSEVHLHPIAWIWMEERALSSFAIPPHPCLHPGDSGNNPPGSIWGRAEGWTCKTWRKAGGTSTAILRLQNLSGKVYVKAEFFYTSVIPNIYY